MVLRSRSRLEENPGAGARAAWKKKLGAGAAKKLAGSSALLEDKKLKEIVLLLGKPQKKRFLH